MNCGVLAQGHNKASIGDECACSPIFLPETLDPGNLRYPLDQQVGVFRAGWILKLVSWPKDHEREK